MRRTILIVSLALALVLAFGATPAFAKYAGYSSTAQYVPWSAALALATSDALMASGPHAGYATTTIKCAVCHSVHRGGSELLNDGTSCAYCHSPAAEGGGAVALNLISWYTPSGGPHASCSSEYCHGGPHGVDASAYHGPASRLMQNSRVDAKLEDLAAVNGVSLASLDTWSPTTRALSIAAACSRPGCHNSSMFGVIAAGAETSVTIAAPGRMVTGHRVIAAARTAGAAGWNASGTEFPSGKTGLQIAFTPVESCSSCHDLSDDNNGGKAAFPHALSGVVNAATGADGTWQPAVWLTAGAYAGSARMAVGANADAGSLLDGICLKCHRGTATSGVGFGY